MFTEISFKFSKLFEEERGNFGDLKKLHDITALLTELKDISGKQNGQLETLAVSIKQLAVTQTGIQHAGPVATSPANMAALLLQSIWKSLPKPVAYIAIGCLGSGAVIGTGFIIYKLVDWINLIF